MRFAFILEEKAWLAHHHEQNTDNGVATNMNMMA
jgi:hypothetical protein